jgi:hypothetical protein
MGPWESRLDLLERVPGGRNLPAVGSVALSVDADATADLARVLPVGAPPETSWQRNSAGVEETPIVFRSQERGHGRPGFLIERRSSTSATFTEDRHNQGEALQILSAPI